MRRIHFSVDDFFETLMDADRYDNLWQQPVFARMKALHEKYGGVFSCYCFYEKGERTLEEISEAHQQEFIANSHWLKFGFHGRNRDTAYGPTKFSPPHMHDTYEQAARDYKAVMDQLGRIMGQECIDPVPRIHYYAGSVEACRAWQDAQWGIKGLLAAEDDRISYYLTSQENAALQSRDRFQESKLGLELYRTKYRLENTPDILSAIQKEPGEELIIFTHEVHLTKDSIWQQFNNCCQIALEEGMKFGFPHEWR